MGNRVLTGKYLTEDTDAGNEIDYVIGPAGIFPEETEFDNLIAFNPALFINQEQYIIKIAATGYEEVEFVIDFQFSEIPPLQ